MERHRINVVAVVTILFVFNAAEVLGVDPDYYVSPNGNNAWNGEYPTSQGGDDGPKATIQEGINVAGSGSTGNYKIIHILNNDGQGCTYDVNSTILLDTYNYQEIIFYQNVVVKGGSWFDSVTYKPLFKIDSVHHIRFTGYDGATFRMTKRPGYTTYNGCHPIRLDGCSNVEILGLTLEKSRGDGIIVRSGPPENILIKDVDCNENCRNGITVYTVDGLTIENCTLRNTSGAVAGPCAGIKIEPYENFHVLNNIVMRDTTIRDNDGGEGHKQLGVSVYALVGDPEPVDMVFERVTVTDGPGIQVYGIYDNGPEGSIEFEDVTVESTHYCVDIRRKSYLKAGVSFEGCKFEETGVDHNPIEIHPENLVQPGDLNFIDCEVFDDIARPAIKFFKGSYDTLHEIHGDLYVIKNECVGPLVDWDGATLDNVDINVYSPGCCKSFNIKDSSGNSVALFDKLGNLYLKGEKEAGRTATTNDEFIFGDDLVIIDTTDGNMYTDGNVSEDQGTLNPQGDNNFIVKDASGSVTAYIDHSGDLFLKGWLYENSKPWTIE